MLALFGSLSSTAWETVWDGSYKAQVKRPLTALYRGWGKKLDRHLLNQSDLILGFLKYALKMLPIA